MLYTNNVFKRQYVSFIHSVGNGFGLSSNNLAVVCQSVRFLCSQA